MGRHSSRVGQRPSQQHLHLGVDAAELVVGPTDERVMDGRIEAKQDLPALVHVYSEPVFTTGDGGWSPHNTTIRLLTMAAFRSSSRVTTPFSVSRLSAISTIPTAPSTIRERAATTALACWRRRIAWAVSGGEARWEIRTSTISTPAMQTRVATSRASWAATTSVEPRSDVPASVLSSYGWV